MDIIDINSWRVRQNDQHFADSIFNYIILKVNHHILIKIPLKFVPRGSINKRAAKVWEMFWWQLSSKPLPEPMLV